MNMQKTERSTMYILLESTAFTNNNETRQSRKKVSKSDEFYQ